MGGTDLTVIGGGAAAVLLVAQLSRATTRPLRVAVVDAGPGRPGAGTAYGTSDPDHYLNVRANRMSALHEHPDDFAEWLAANSPDACATDFVARAGYGDYLAAVAADADAGFPIRVDQVRCRATGLARGEAGWQIRLDDGSLLSSPHVALATGVPPPSLAWTPPGLLASGCLVADPWKPGALDPVGETDPVLLVGTGLTAVDLALTLARSGRPLTAVSRHGLLPAAHTATVLPPMPVEEAGLPTTLTHLRRYVRARVADSRAACGDWRPAIDGLRPHLQRIWMSLGDGDRAEFLSRDLRRWETARHRMAPAAAARIAGLRASGQLTVRAGDARAAAAQAPPRTWVVNATGPDGDLRRSVDPLIRGLFEDGIARPGPLGIGLDTDLAGRLRDATGAAVPGLWTLGATRRGQLWESTAVPEIRAQAYELAGRIAAARPAATPGPRQDTADGKRVTADICLSNR